MQPAWYIQSTLSNADLSSSATSASTGLSHPKRVVIWSVVVFLLALLVRLALVLASPLELQEPEPVRIAISLATTGRYADAYGPGVGPTAHCAPLHPLMLSVLVRLFGYEARGALAMGILGSVEAALAFALLPALALASGLGLSSGVKAGMAGALLPVNYWAQTNGAFDASLTSVLLLALCLLLCRIWAAARFTKTEGVAFGITAGLGCLANPALIPVLALWSVASAVRYRRQLRRVLIFLAVSAMCVLCLLAPWAIRNYISLGSLIWTRSNFGLELQVSNNDMLTADLERNVRMREFAMLHPFTGTSERDKVRRVGEVAYQRSKEQEAFAWIASHKRRFLLLTIERFRLFWIPRMRRVAQMIFECALTVVGLSGLAMLFWKGQASAWVLGGALAAYPLVYYVIQVSPRYRFPVECILFLLAAKMCSSIVLALRTRSIHAIT